MNHPSPQTKGNVAAPADIGPEFGFVRKAVTAILVAFFQLGPASANAALWWDSPVWQLSNWRVYVETVGTGTHRYGGCDPNWWAKDLSAPHVTTKITCAVRTEIHPSVSDRFEAASESSGLWIGLDFDVLGPAGQSYGIQMDGRFSATAIGRGGNGNIDVSGGINGTDGVRLMTLAQGAYTLDTLKTFEALSTDSLRASLKVEDSLNASQPETSFLSELVSVTPGTHVNVVLWLDAKGDVYSGLELNTDMRITSQSLFTVALAPVPEPASMSLMALGLAGLGWTASAAARRRRAVRHANP